MCVIDQNGDAILFKQVHSSLNLIFEQTFSNGLIVHSHRFCRDDRSQSVFHIESSRHADTPSVLLHSVAGGKGKSDILFLNIAQNPAILIVQICTVQSAKGDDSFCVCTCTLQYTLGMIHITIDYRCFAVLHKLEFAGEVIFKIGVFQRTDVIFSDIEEHSQIIFHTVNTVELICLRRNFHGQKGDTAVSGLCKVALKIRGLWGGQMRFMVLDSGVHFNGGKNRTLWSTAQLRIFCAECIQNIFHKIGGSCLSLSSSQTNQSERLICFPVKGDCHQTHCFANIAGQDIRNCLGKAFFCKICPCSFFHCIQQILLFESSSLADKEGVLLYIRGAV